MTDLLNDILDLMKNIDPSLASHMATVFVTLFMSIFYNNVYIGRMQKMHKEEIERLTKIYSDTQNTILKAYSVPLSGKSSNSNYSVKK